MFEKGRRLALGGVLAASCLLGVSGLEGQRRFPGAPEAPTGRPVSPAFEGWYENPDGTYTLSFGYFNRSEDEVLFLPAGSDNFIEPAGFDGPQPDIFLARRHVGVFTVTVPGDFAEGGGRVVWTLRNRGVVHAVPGRIGVGAYQLHYRPMAMGSLAPLLKFSEDGPELWGVMTNEGDPRESFSGLDEPPPGSAANALRMSATVGEPVDLDVWVSDRLQPGAEREVVGGGATWYTHRGPALAEFSPDDPEPDAAAGGRATMTVRFPEPGDYLLRVRADNFNPVDSSPGDQCCWTNGYVAVTVSP